MPKVAQSIFDEYEKYYVEQGMTLQDVALEFGLNYGSLRQYSMKQKWSEKQKEYREATHKKLTQITQIRINKEAETLDHKNLRRAVYWRAFQSSIMDMLDARSDELKPQEIAVLASAFEKACRGERLEDGQAVEIHKVETPIKPDAECAMMEEYEMRLLRQRGEIKKLSDVLVKNKIDGYYKNI